SLRLCRSVVVVMAMMTGLFLGFFSRFFEPAFYSPVAEVQLHHRRFRGLEADDHHAHLAARRTGVDQGRLAVSAGTNPDKRVPARPQGTLDHAADICGIGGHLEILKECDFHTADAFGPG